MLGNIVYCMIKRGGCCAGQITEPETLVNVKLFGSRLNMKKFIATQFGVNMTSSLFQSQFDANYNKGLKQKSACSCAHVYIYGDRKQIDQISSNIGPISEFKYDHGQLDDQFDDPMEEDEGYEDYLMEEDKNEDDLKDKTIKSNPEPPLQVSKQLADLIGLDSTVVQPHHRFNLALVTYIRKNCRIVAQERRVKDLFHPDEALIALFDIPQDWNLRVFTLFDLNALLYRHISSRKTNNLVLAETDPIIAAPIENKYRAKSRVFCNLQTTLIHNV